MPPLTQHTRHRLALVRLLIPLTPSAAACSLCPSLVVSPGGRSQTAPWIRFRCRFSLLLPPENDQGGSYFSCTRWAEAYTPHSFSPCSECIPGVVCSAVHTCVSTHSEYIDSRELRGPSHQSPAFASLEPGCFQPGFSSKELSPALLPLLRTTWFLCSHLVLRQDM